jgi:hypothetical protein
LAQSVFVDRSRFEFLVLRSKFSNHSFFRLRAQNSMVREMHVPEKINALMPLPEEHFCGMQIQIEIAQEEISHERQNVFKFPSIAGKQYEIVGVTEIILDAKIALYILIESIKINIRKNLRCEIAERDAFSGLRLKTVENVLDKGHDSIVADTFPA